MDYHLDKCECPTLDAIFRGSHEYRHTFELNCHFIVLGNWGVKYSKGKYNCPS